MIVIVGNLQLQGVLKFCRQLQSINAVGQQKCGMFNDCLLSGLIVWSDCLVIIDFWHQS